MQVCHEKEALMRILQACPVFQCAHQVADVARSCRAMAGENAMLVCHGLFFLLLLYASAGDIREQKQNKNVRPIIGTDAASVVPPGFG
jgi:hypothetical protein